MNFLSLIGLGSFRSQIIAAGAAVIAALIIFVIWSWKSDIEEKTRLEIGKELSDGKIETIDKGKKVDEKVLNSDDAGLCILLGGCVSDDEASDGN